MADPNAPAMIVQPPVQNTPEQVRVFAMPARYRHGAVASVVEPQKASSASVVVVQPPVPPKVLAPLPSAVQATPQTAHTKKGLLIAGVIVLIALGIGGYMFWRSVQKNAEVVTQELPAGTQTTPEVPGAGTTPPETPTTPITPPGTNPFPSAVTPGVDTDSDGLSDGEETIVYGTNTGLPDSDGDGFLDGNEVFHGYNPNGTAPGTLVLAGLAQLLTIDGFQMLYPTKWTVLPAVSGEDSIISTGTGETVTVTVLTKDASLALVDWYQQSGKVGAPSPSKTKKAYPMLVEKNQLATYIDLGTQVVSLVYDTSSKATIDYLQTFQMMVNSVEKL